MATRPDIAQGAGFRFFSAAALLILVGTYVATDGNLILALLPVLMGLGAFALWRLPMQQLAHGVLFFCLLVDNPTERPGRNLYRSPLYLPGTFVYETLEKSAHLPGLKASGLQLLVLSLFAIIGLRIWTGDTTDGTRRLPAAQPMIRSCLAAVGGLFALFVYGLGRGGVSNYAILQMQTMIFVPLMTLFFAYAFKTPRDARALLKTFLIVGLLRAFECLYYWITFMRAQGAAVGGEEGDGSYVTTHSDSILATVAVIILICNVYQSPRLRAFILAFAALPVVGLGIVANNRRIAFVGIALGLLLSYLASRSSFKRRVHQTVFVMMPFGLLYLGAGWSAHGAWAKPVQSLRSVIEQKDSSSATRDIENNNLLLTLKQNPLIGSGYGHMYIEKIRAFDISGIFQAYRYVPHNSILWFWSCGGVVGFSCYWMFVSVGAFLAARLCRYGTDVSQRLLGMATLAALAAWGVQSFGDMGLMSWMGGLIVSSTLGAVASLIVRSGGYGRILVEPSMPIIPETSTPLTRGRLP